MWSRFFDSGFFTILYPVLLVSSLWAGFLLARRFLSRRQREWKPSGAETAVIGLFGLMLSFTFMSAGNSMRERNQQVHLMADAVADLRRESLFTDDSLKDMTKRFLVQYLELQTEFNERIRKDREKFIATVSTLNGSYLSQLTGYAKLGPSQQTMARQLLPLYSHLNKQFFRVAYQYEERVPKTIFLMLVIASLLIGVLIGFMNGFGKDRHLLLPVIFALVVAFAILAIRDLDNPVNGSIRPGYNNFRQQLETLRTSTR